MKCGGKDGGDFKKEVSKKSASAIFAFCQVVTGVSCGLLWKEGYPNGFPFLLLIIILCFKNRYKMDIISIPR
ncbi:MAG: hypothetical protein D6785_04465 [Planctomycetota bacterium]|nr:MAG: hypothetical protein D6785_04465 [Planctomycetota bacterium]